MNISLPESMRAYVESQVEAGSYSSASEYVRALIREDRKRREKERLEALLLEGLNSGPAAEMTPADWEQIRAEVRQRIAERQGAIDGQAERQGYWARSSR